MSGRETSFVALWLDLRTRAWLDRLAGRGGDAVAAGDLAAKLLREMRRDDEAEEGAACGPS